MNEKLEKQKLSEKSPQDYREVAIGEGALGYAWDKIGSKINLARIAAEDPLKRPFFIQTEDITLPDGSVTNADTYIVVNDMVIDLKRTIANKPDVMSLKKALSTGILPPVLEVGRSAGEMGIIDSVVWYYGNGYPEEISNNEHGTLLFDIEELIDDHTGKNWQEFIEEKTGRVMAEASDVEIEFSEVASSNIEKLKKAEFGPDVIKVYQQLIIDHPDLANISINVKTATEANGNSHKVDRTTGTSEINLRLDRQYYSDLIQNSGFADRFGRYVRLQAELGRHVNDSDLAIFTLLHEFGHAKDYLRRRSEDPTMNEADFAASDKAKRKAEMKTLPLPGGSRTFMKKYNLQNDNTKAQQRALVGVSTDAGLRQLVRITDRAYANLASEKAADDFAIEEYRKINEI